MSMEPIVTHQNRNTYTILSWNIYGNTNATDLNGCQGYDTNTIIVDTLPIANFNATEVCHNDITIFMDSSIGTSATVDQWSWNMGGSGTYVNGTSSTDDTTYYIYDNPGTYTVILTITDTNDCQHSDTNTVIVRPNPMHFVSDSVCVGFNTTLISTSISDPSYQTISGTIQSWDWEFGDSQDSCCVEDTIQHAYTTDGIYTAQLIVIDSYGCKRYHYKSSCCKPWT